MGRPVKGNDPLCNEVKVRLSDATLANIDAQAAKLGCNRAECIRGALDGVFKILQLGEDARNRQD